MIFDYDKQRNKHFYLLFIVLIDFFLDFCIASFHLIQHGRHVALWRISHAIIFICLQSFHIALHFFQQFVRIFRIFPKNKIINLSSVQIMLNRRAVQMWQLFCCLSLLHSHIALCQKNQAVSPPPSIFEWLQPFRPIITVSKFPPIVEFIAQRIQAQFSNYVSC